MSEAQVLLEFRMIQAIEKEGQGEPEREYNDPEYEAELRERGISPEMLREMRGHA